MALTLSPKWLEKIVGVPFDHSQVLNRLSELGLETEAVPSTTQKLKNVVTGQVISTKPHPDADRLKVCEVDVNVAENLTIVCGCPSVKPNMIVAVAQDGAILPEMTIKSSELRGVASEGMLCTALELGVTSLKDSLLSLPAETPLGVPIESILSLDREWLEVEITPNRGDCVSALGVARELSIILDQPLNLQSSMEQTIDQSAPMIDTIHEACLSYAYAAVGVKNLEGAALPIDMAHQLHVSGFNRVNTVVDLLNYVMLYLGQPMHAFDLDKIKGKISIRHAHSGESLLLLDGEEVFLLESDLVIADETGPIALAGIMGGEATKVTESTTNLLLESACFDAVTIAKTAKRMGIVTDASYRYVRGTDPELAINALKVLLDAMHDVFEISIKTTGYSNHIADKTLIRIGLYDVSNYLGIEISMDELKGYMESIGCKIEIVESDFLTILPPSYRNDLNAYYDLIEEVARLYGYENLPKEPLTLKPLQQEDISLANHQVTAECLVSRGYQELYSLSLQSRAHALQFANEDALIYLDNPLSEEYSVLRPSILSSLYFQVQQCLNHFVKHGRMVEVGNAFRQPDIEIHSTGLIVFGENETLESNLNDYAQIKGDVQAYLHRLKPGLKIDFVPVNASHDLPLGWHPNQTAAIVSHSHMLGFVGALHPKLQQSISVPCFAAELDLDALRKIHAEFKRPSRQSKFPPSTRDLSFWVSEDDYAADIQNKLANVSELITNVVVVDDYYAKDAEQRSLTFRLTFQSFSKTLKDKEIDGVIRDAVNLFEDEHIKLRDH